MIDSKTVLLLKGGNVDPAFAFPGLPHILSGRRRGNVTRRKIVTALYDELRLTLFGYLCSIGLHPEQAEDVIQETFLRLFRDFSEELVLDSVRPWTFRVANNVAIDELRKKKYVLEMNEEAQRVVDLRVDPCLNPEESFARKEELNRLLVAISKLPEQQQQCLHLRAEGLRYREIATVLGVSIPRVSVLLEKALAHLAGEL